MGQVVEVCGERDFTLGSPALPIIYPRGHDTLSPLLSPSLQPRVPQCACKLICGRYKSQVGISSRAPVET